MRSVLLTFFLCIVDQGSIIPRCFPWSDLWVQRYVAVSSADSNQRLVRESGLAERAGRFVCPNSSLPLAECVREYEQRVRELLGPDPGPDLLVLGPSSRIPAVALCDELLRARAGMGEDGHIASLFPPLGMEVAAAEALVVNTQTQRFAVPQRITLTLSPLAAARAHLFLFKVLLLLLLLLLLVLAVIILPAC
jgi:hypothetical protein